MIFITLRRLIVEKEKTIVVFYFKCLQVPVKFSIIICFVPILHLEIMNDYPSLQSVLHT